MDWDLSKLTGCWLLAFRADLETAKYNYRVPAFACV